jgi:hypothetical protein
MSIEKMSRIAFSVTVLVSLTALGGVTAPSANASQLLPLLPDGFGSSNCRPHDDPIPDALETIFCWDNPNGPYEATFALFSDQGSMDYWFDAWLADTFLEDCPGGVGSPGVWYYGENSDDIGGRVACGYYRDKPDLLWTQNAELIMGDMAGASI